MTGPVTEFRLGRADALTVGEGQAYAVGDEMVAVFLLRSGEVRAVSAVCPHAGGPIADGLADAEVVICPLHQHVFDLASGCSRTGQPPLTSYPARIDEGELVVSVPKPAPADRAEPDSHPRPEVESRR
ncbi:Rieske (2Fe-2S) protein [Plantactinospora sp. S1510]|uniref:Rieske (2Fe-2S) protein n=1 Tax=Plantactinospora alkalitolerans TaxID=2789879 RepID=A0ABS0GSU2_9ACTN|nr:Rieske (2Fe-2S) protein [Plantactinospora alkalitolerans]MBF9128967.1 Rieske (2Fe-2S) protein [Plantactinospora alkalitolerans]